jgi:cbb3-type cytochrome oxidase maturation protein
MTILLFLAPLSVILGLTAVAAFLWTLRSNQYDDPQGDAARILIDDDDDLPRVSVGPRSHAALEGVEGVALLLEQGEGGHGRQGHTDPR